MDDQLPENPLKNLEKLISALQAEKYDLDSYQIAESLWLWQQKQQYQDTLTENILEDRISSPDSGEFSTANFSPPTSPSLPITLNSEGKGESDEQSEDESDKKDVDQKNKSESLPISPPDTAFLRNTLTLSRVARPLIQKIDSATRDELNIQRTVKETAEYSLGNKKENRKGKLTIIPHYKPTRVRSLDAILIIEESTSMVLWKEMAAEVRDWLERLGAFRDVKLYRMGWDKKVEIKPLWSQVQILSPKDLNHPRGERLIFFFSDCTSPAWYQGHYNKILKEWGEKI
jgi:hypothetical protein